MEHCIKVEPGVEIFVLDLNPTAQKTILLIHGWPGNHNLFEYQYEELTGRGYRVIGIDIRGFGQSSKPLHGYDYNRLADDVRGVIDALHLRNITLLGHSTGGAIALRYMCRHHGYGVAKLVLCAAAAPSLVRRAGFPYGLDPNVVTDMIDAAYDDRPLMLFNFGKQFFHQPVSAPFSQWIFDLGLVAASWSTIAVMRTWLAESLFEDMCSISVPTLIMHGCFDQVVPFDLGVIQHQCIKGSCFVPFEESGHGLFYEERTRFNNTLANFIC